MGAVRIVRAVALSRAGRCPHRVLSSRLSALCPQHLQALDSNRLGLNPVFADASLTTDNDVPSLGLSFLICKHGVITHNFQDCCVA